jgi:hypothetical protein
MVAYMMAAKFMHVNLRSIINTTTPTSPSPASTPEESEALPFSSLVETINPQLPPSSAERSTIRNDDKKDTPTLPPIIPPPHDQTLPSPPTSPKTYSDTDPTNYHYFKATPKKQAPPADRHFQILRMELEFLHFLNYDLTLRDTLRLIHWAQKFEEDAAKTPDYSSGDEGGDE